MINLSQQDLEGVLNYLNEQPAKIANPLINFFNKKIIDYNEAQKQQEAFLKEQEEAQQNQKEDSETDSQSIKPPSTRKKKIKNIEVIAPNFVPSPETDPLDD
jgi:hypothetical protein